MFPLNLFLKSILLASYAVPLNAASLGNAAGAVRPPTDGLSATDGQSVSSNSDIQNVPVASTVDVSDGTIANSTAATSDTNATVTATDDQIIQAPFPGLTLPGGNVQGANVTEALSRRDAQGRLTIRYTHRSINIADGFNLTGGPIDHNLLELVLQDMVYNVSFRQQEAATSYIRLDARNWTLVLNANISNLVSAAITVSPPESFGMDQILYLLQMWQRDLHKRPNSRLAYCGKIVNAQGQVLAIVGMVRSFSEVPGQQLTTDIDAAMPNDSFNSTNVTTAAVGRRPLATISGPSPGRYFGTVAVAATNLVVQWAENQALRIGYMDAYGATYDGLRGVAYSGRLVLDSVAMSCRAVTMMVALNVGLTSLQARALIGTISDLVDDLLRARLPEPHATMEIHDMPLAALQTSINAIRGIVLQHGIVIGTFAVTTGENLPRWCGASAYNCVGYHGEL